MAMDTSPVISQLGCSGTKGIKFGAEGMTLIQSSPPLGNFCEMGLWRRDRGNGRAGFVGGGGGWGKGSGGPFMPYVSLYTSQLGLGASLKAVVFQPLLDLAVLKHLAPPWQKQKVQISEDIQVLYLPFTSSFKCIKIAVVFL